MIKAVIFDCFGVLVQETFHAFGENHFSHDEAKLQKMRDLDAAANRGLVTHDELIQQFAELSGMSVEEVETETSQNPLSKRLFAYIENELKPTYKIGMLSNVASDLLDRLFTKQQQALFDDIVLSFQVGMIKPEQHIYELAASRLGVLPEECIFTDDSVRHCAGAEAVGMKSMLYQNFAQFEQDIRNLLQ